MIESLIIAVVVFIVAVRIFFTATFWLVLGGIIAIGVTGYLFFWVWLFVVAMMAVA